MAFYTFFFEFGTGLSQNPDSTAGNLRIYGILDKRISSIFSLHLLRGRMQAAVRCEL